MAFQEQDGRAQPFRAKRINRYNDFVARVALEVVDTSGWKQQLRVKRAGSGKTALSSNESAAGVIRLRPELSKCRILTTVAKQFEKATFLLQSSTSRAGRNCCL
jgi:hypothetical protein